VKDPSLDVSLLAPCFWPEVRRGMERFTRELADGLLARGHRPKLITSHPGHLTRNVEDGLPIVRVPRPPRGRLERRRYEIFLTHVPLSYAALRTSHTDIAHAMFPTDALAAARWKRATGGPALLSFMGIPDFAYLRERRRRLEVMQHVLRECDVVVALSRHVADAFRYWLGYEAPVIEPGVDIHKFAPGPERTAEPTIICAAAAEEPRKHVGLLVEAFKLVRRQRPEARLVLSRPRDLELVRRQAGVDVYADGVEWADLDTREALARAYAEAWVSVLPSVSEAFGLVLAEAMACGTPGVGYDSAGIPEVIDRPEVGRLFDKLEPRPLADAILAAMEMASDPSTTVACRSRAEEISTDRCTERYLDLYLRLLAERQS
jgi:phosphatidylinositol alpha-mannosyltransferase